MIFTLLIQLVARAAAGEHRDKQWCIFFGQRNSGKGVLQEINEKAFPGIVVTVASKSFAPQKGKGDAAFEMNWVIPSEHSRFTYANEIETTGGGQRSSNMPAVLQGSQLKMMQSGGDYILVRGHRELKPWKMRVASKLFFNVNQQMNVDPPDALQTCVVFKCPYEFVSAAELQKHEESGPEGKETILRLQDPDVKDKVFTEDFLDAYTWRVTNAYAEDVVKPSERVRQDTADFIRHPLPSPSLPPSFIVSDFVTAHFEVTKNGSDYVLSEKITDLLTKAGWIREVEEVKKFLIGMGAEYSENCGKTKKGTLLIRGRRGLKKVKVKDPVSLSVNPLSVKEGEIEGVGGLEEEEMGGEEEEMGSETGLEIDQES